MNSHAKKLLVIGLYTLAVITIPVLFILMPSELIYFTPAGSVWISFALGTSEETGDFMGVLLLGWILAFPGWLIASFFAAMKTRTYTLFLAALGAELGVSAFQIIVKVVAAGTWGLVTLIVAYLVKCAGCVGLFLFLSDDRERPDLEKLLRGDGAQ